MGGSYLLRRSRPPRRTACRRLYRPWNQAGQRRRPPDPQLPDIFVVAHSLFAIGAIAMPLGLTATHAELAALGAKTGFAAVIAAPRAEGGSRSAHRRRLTRRAAVPHEQTERRRASTHAPPKAVWRHCRDLSVLLRLDRAAQGRPAYPRRTSRGRCPHQHGLGPAARRCHGQYSAAQLRHGLSARRNGRHVPRRHDAILERLCFLSPFRGAKLLEAMVANRVTLIGAVPAMYEIIAAAGR